MIVQTGSLLLLNEEVDDILALFSLSGEEKIVLVGCHSIRSDYILYLVRLERLLLDEWFSESLVDSSMACSVCITRPVQILLFDLNVLHALRCRANSTIVDTLCDDMNWVHLCEQKIQVDFIDRTQAYGINVEKIVELIKSDASAIDTLHDRSVLFNFDTSSALFEQNFILDDFVTVAYIKQLVFEVISRVSWIL